MWFIYLHYFHVNVEDFTAGDDDVELVLTMKVMTMLVMITLLPGVPGSESMAEGEVGCSDMM